MTEPITYDPDVSHDLDLLIPTFCNKSVGRSSLELKLNVVHTETPQYLEMVSFH